MKTTVRHDWFRAGAFLLVLLGLGWLIADRLLRNFFPLKWGGPNIGGGLLFVLALLAVLAGAVLVVADTIWRPRGSRATAATWVGVSISGFLAITLVLVLIVDPRDETAGLNGWVGVTASDSGSPVLVLQICRGSIDDVTIYGPNRGSVPNEELAEFHTDQPATASFRLDLIHPPTGWTALPGSTLFKADSAGLKIALGTGRSNELRQVVFTDANIAHLQADTVLFGISGERRVPLADFPSVACP